MANFFNEHINKIEEISPLSISQLQKGMVVKATYKKKKTKKQPARTKEYMLLILNRGYENYVHALSMEKFTNKELNNLAEKYGLIYLKVPPKFKALDFPKIIMKESSQRFYAHAIKKLIGNKLGKSYRTLLIKSFGPLSVVDYEFDERIQDLYLK